MVHFAKTLFKNDSGLQKNKTAFFKLPKSTDLIIFPFIPKFFYPFLIFQTRYVVVQ